MATLLDENTVSTRYWHALSPEQVQCDMCPRYCKLHEGKKPGSNVILQGLGPEPDIIPEVQLLKIQPGDAFLLCSDGLNDMLSELRIEEIIQNLDVGNIEEKVDELIAAANDGGGRDNISVILVCQ